MAKSNSILDLQGTLAGITHVDSRRYGKHTRMARRSCEVNDVFKENQVQMTEANKPAKLIKHVVDFYRDDFKGGTLWQWLVKRFKAQAKAKTAFDVTDLTGLEVHDDYHLARFLRGRCEWSLKTEGQTLSFTLNRVDQPLFKGKFFDAYSLSAIAAFPDFEAGTAEHSMASTPLTALNENFNPHEFRFEIPEGAKQYLIILKIQAHENGKVCPGHSTKGMRFVAAGKFEEEIA